jgi:hypothetical protein
MHPDVAVVVYNATRPANTPSRAVVYIHGGGFVHGNASFLAPIAGYLQRTLDATVISVDYRLAPAHPFPAAVEDSAAAIAWIADNAAALNILPTNIVVTGDSAGGNLALVCLFFPLYFFSLFLSLFPNPRKQTSMLWLRQYRPTVFSAVSHIVPIYPTTDGACIACYPSTHLFGKVLKDIVLKNLKSLMSAAEPSTGDGRVAPDDGRVCARLARSRRDLACLACASLAA